MNMATQHGRFIFCKCISRKGHSRWRAELKAVEGTYSWEPGSPSLEAVLTAVRLQGWSLQVPPRRGGTEVGQIQSPESFTKQGQHTPINTEVLFSSVLPPSFLSFCLLTSSCPLISSEISLTCEISRVWRQQ